MLSNASPLNKIKSHLHLLLLTGLLLLLFLDVSAKNYYFSSSAGNDTYTAVQAQNVATPWRSITKLNSVFSTLIGGDSILFKRGEVFYGTIAVTSSGLSTKSIVFSAYGSGANPIISGFTTITSWAADATAGVYKTSASNIVASNISAMALNMVTLNNQPQQIGRYPNANAANGGYLKYQSFVDTLGLTSITDSQLTSAVNWTGAEVVIRKRLWVLDRCKVTSHTGNTVYYTNPENSTYTGTKNFGYFFQNNIRTLDQFGEWYFDQTAGELKMYFGTAIPSAYTIKAATLDELVNIRGKQYISFNNLAFEGANRYGIYATVCDYITIKNCSFINIGGTAVYMEGTTGITVESSSTYNILNNALQFSCSNDSNITIRNCTVKRTGALRGMGGSSGASYKGISIDLAKNLLIENNRVDTTGYVAIEFDGSNVMVRNNVVNYFDFNKDDAGGIYSWVPGGETNDIYYENRVIKNNIVMNGIGAPDGRSSSTLYVSGIYLDGIGMNVDIIDNTVFNMGKNGIHCNNPNNVTVSGNTSFNNLNAVSFMKWPWGTINNLTIKNNIFYPKTSNQQNLFYTNAALNEPDSVSLPDALRSVGTIDSNYYSSSNLSGFSYEVYATSGGTYLPYSSHSLEGWQSFSGKDIHSKRPVREAPTYYLRNTVGSSTVINGSFDAGINNISAVGTGAVASWDNTGKISGGSLKIQMSSPVANRYVLIYSSIGPVSASKKYVLRFKTLGTTAFGIVRAYIRKTTSPFISLTPIQVKVFDTTVKQHEFLFAAPAAESGASFVIEIEQNSGTTYIDNIEFYEADADVYNAEDYLRFEYNATNTPVTINLGTNYVGVNGAYYPGTITLQPFTSKILVKDTSILRQALAVQVMPSVIACYGQRSDVTVTATGGIPPYTGTGRFRAAAGTYTYTVTDLRGVSSSTTIIIRQPLAPLDVTATTGTITIYGGSTWVNLSATGGTAPYTGVLNFTNVTAGSHTYAIKDANGCIDSVTIFLTQPEPLKAFANAVNVNCYGGTGTIAVTATGGVPPYYGTGVFTMYAGTYRYKVRDAAGAVAYAPILLTQPILPLQATASAGIINVFGGTASVSITATGGTAPYTGTGTISNVVAGTYLYTVTDAKGCIASASVTISQPASLLTASATTGVIKCFDGSVNITVSASGGVVPYNGAGSYAVNAGKGSLKLSFPAVVNDTYTLLYYSIGSVVPSKNYALRFSTVGTQASGTVRASLRQTFSPWASFTPRQTASFGTARIDHEFIFTAPAAEPNASFLIEILQNSGITYIDNIAFFELDANNKLTGSNLYGFGDFETDINNIFYYSANNNQTLALDTSRKISRIYYFAVSDAVNASVNAVAKTSQPAAQLVANVSAGNINVTGGTTSVTVTATGGTPPYTGTGSFTDVPAGTRTYTVTDANACTASKTITLSIAARPVAASTQQKELTVVVYPNPSSSSFDIWLQNTTNENTIVTVCTADGKTMYKAEGKLQQHYVFGENFSSGLYIVKITQGKVIKTLRVIKVKL
jgi:hypothetical protein